MMAETFGFCSLPARWHGASRQAARALLSAAWSWRGPLFSDVAPNWASASTFKLPDGACTGHEAPRLSRDVFPAQDAPLFKLFPRRGLPLRDSCLRCSQLILTV